MITWLIDNIRNCGIGADKITVAINQFDNEYKFILNKLGVNVVNVGATTGPAATLQALLHDCQYDEMMVLYGDSYVSQQDLYRLINGKDKNIALMRELPNEEQSDRISFNTNLGFDFKYHPRRAGYNKEAIAYRFKHNIMDIFESGLPNIYQYMQCGMMPQHEYYIEPVVAEFIKQDNEVEIMDCQYQSFNVDYPWHILQLNSFLNQQRCENIDQNTIGQGSTISDDSIVNGNIIMGKNSQIGDRVIINGNVIIGDNTKIIDGAMIDGNVVIGDNNVIKEYCKIFGNSTVGNNCVIGHGAELEGQIMNNTYLYHYCEVNGLLGRSVDIAAGVAFGSLRFDDNKTIHNINGKRIQPSNFANAVYIGDFVRTGVNATIMPGVKIGNNCVISANLCVDKDVPSNKLLQLKQEVIEKDWSPDKYGQ